MTTRRAFGGIRKLPSGYHQAYYTGPDKARHTSWTTYATRGAAERWLEDERRLVEDGTWTPPKRRDPYADSTMPTLTEAHKQGARAVGKPDLTVHDLRRTGATLAAQSGATIKEVMGMLGHTQPGVAMLYQVADADRDRERAARMSRLALEA